MYQSSNWWHNYQIYRRKSKIYDNTPNRNGTPCFTYLPWKTLKKGDRLHLEVWAPDNKSSYFTREQVLAYLKKVEKIRALEFKVVEDGERIITIHWYHSKVQMFSALTIVRFASEDNWNGHRFIVPFVLSCEIKMSFAELMLEAHKDQKEKGSYNSGHNLFHELSDTEIPSNNYLEKMKKSSTSINEFWRYGK